MTGEIHDSPGKILVTMENSSGQEGIPSSPMLTLAVFENRDGPLLNAPIG